MATEALQELLKNYDIEQNGCLDKTAWIKMCAHDGINLAPEVAGTLFDDLDTDADGQVPISDIVRELSNAAAAWDLPTTPLLQERRAASVDPTQNDSPSSVRKNSHSTRESRQRVKKLQLREHSRFLSQSSGAHSDHSGGLFTTKREMAEDGSEVYCTTPILLTPKYRNLLELETEISRSYPKLLPSFNHVIDDFRTEILSSRQEQSSLEQNYLNEKAARKRDLQHMEAELEIQIQRIEDRTKEMQESIRTQYDGKILAKEREIADIRAQVESLKAKFEDKYGSSGSIPPDSTTTDQRKTNYSPPTPSPYTQRSQGRKMSSAQIRDQNHLQEVLAKLESREDELMKLKKQLMEQEVQILVDKRELLNRDEEKQQLYVQLENLRMALSRQDDQDMYSQFHGRQSPLSSHSHPESLQSFNNAIDAPTTPKPPERIFKIILIGDTGVGKSSFMHQFCDGVFYPRLSATVGVDFRTRNIRFDKNVYSIQLWDTAGQEKYRSIVRTYFRKTDGVIIVYDVTAPQTFRNVRSWMEQISEFGGEQKVPVIVIGNKIDLRPSDATNCVTTEMGQKFAEAYNVMFLETSVCTAQNVDETVRVLASQMKVEQDTQLATTVQLSEKPAAQRRACCG